MLVWIYALFILGHGIAHMVYTSPAMGWLPELENQSTWSGASWVLTGSLGLPTTRVLGAVFFTAITALFAITAGGIAFGQPWATAWLQWTAIASSLGLIFFWDGSPQDFVSKGLIGLAINIGLLIALLVFKFPAI
jgi:hypothetical protein